MLKYILMAGVAAALMSVAPPAFANAKPFGCTRTLVGLSPPVSVIYSGCKLKWWGAHFVPGGANGGGSSWVEPPEVKHYCPPPPPCRKETVWTYVN